jgi:hypothetical protein
MEKKVSNILKKVQENSKQKFASDKKLMLSKVDEYQKALENADSKYRFLEIAIETVEKLGREIYALRDDLKYEVDLHSDAYEEAIDAQSQLNNIMLEIEDYAATLGINDRDFMPDYSKAVDLVEREFTPNDGLSLDTQIILDSL